jgi:hypothetical protein
MRALCENTPKDSSLELSMKVEFPVEDIVDGSKDKEYHVKSGEEELNTFPWKEPVGVHRELSNVI